VSSAGEGGFEGFEGSYLGKRESLRAELGDGPLIVCPGIRATPGGDDQQRTVDVVSAFANGADYIVVGRPIRQAADPRAAAEAIQQVIRGCFPA